MEIYILCSVKRKVIIKAYIYSSKGMQTMETGYKFKIFLPCVCVCVYFDMLQCYKINAHKTV